MQTHAQPVATTPAEESLLTRGVVFLFVGAGLSVFLSVTHTWFYGVFSTALTMFVDVTSVLGTAAGVGQRNWRRTHLLFWRRLLHMLLWAVPVLFYVYETKCAHLLRASTVHDQRFEACFREAFILWLAYLLLGGRIFSEVLGFSWWKMRLGGVFTLFHARDRR